MPAQAISPGGLDKRCLTNRTRPSTWEGYIPLHSNLVVVVQTNRHFIKTHEIGGAPFGDQRRSKSRRRSS
jgi:hypothetical protein